MAQKRRKKPDFYNSFMKAGFFPDANKIIKYTESLNYWIFKTGKQVVKVKKNESESSAISLEEVFCRTTVNMLQKMSPELQPKVVTVKKSGDEYVIDRDGSIAGDIIYYAIESGQLTDGGFLDVLISKGKLTLESTERVTGFLYDFHSKTDVSTSKEDGTVEQLDGILQNLFYQSKKFLGDTITQPMIDMSFRPLERFLENHKKLLSRRIKRDAIKLIHGRFVPEKIHVHKDQVSCLAKSSDPLKNRYMDVASDVADITVELLKLEQKEAAEHFVKSYARVSADKDLKLVLPFYQALKALALGVKHSTASKFDAEKEAEVHKDMAIGYYNLLLEIVHQLPK